MSGILRHRRLALVAGAVLAIALPSMVVAAYPPGPFPGPGPVGGYPKVIVSQTVCGAGVITADDGQATVTIEIPAGAFADCTQVTVYGTSKDSLAAALPSDQTLIRSYAVGWDGPDAAGVIVLTIDDPDVGSDSLAYRTKGSGLVKDVNATLVSGSGSTPLISPIGFVLAAPQGAVADETDPPAPETSTSTITPSSGDPMRMAAVIVFVLLGSIGFGLFMISRRWQIRD
jgi:hypothetical protein